MKNDKINSPEKGPYTLLSNHLDREIRSAVNNAEPPSWLRESITQLKEEKSNNLIRPSFRVLSIAAMLIIACTLAVIGFGMMQNNELQTEMSLREATADYILDGGFFLDFNSDSLEDIHQWLTNQGAIKFEGIPARLASEEPIGCKELKWRDNKITLVCFHLPDGGIVHMFIGEKDDVSSATLANIAKVQRIQGLETGGWESEGKVYLLTGSEPDVSIQKYLLEV